jgi:hypothetical protein
MSPIYELPTRSPRRYRGKYPERVWSVGYARGAVHVELNNGRRFVALRSHVMSYDPTNELMGRHVSKCFKPIGQIPTMSESDYAGVMLMIRLVRGLRYKASRIDLATGNMER